MKIYIKKSPLPSSSAISHHPYPPAPPPHSLTPSPPPLSHDTAPACVRPAQEMITLSQPANQLPPGHQRLLLSCHDEYHPRQMGLFSLFLCLGDCQRKIGILPARITRAKTSIQIPDKMCLHLFIRCMLKSYVIRRTRISG